MKPGIRKLYVSAFTRIELVVIVAVITILMLMILPPLSTVNRREVWQKQCVENQRQLEIAYKTWAVDCGAEFPMYYRTNDGGTREFVLEGKMFRHYQAMSNELGGTKLLVCPSDTRLVASSFDALQNTNISYFVGVDASDTYPQLILLGDRNLKNPRSLANSLFVVLDTDSAAYWTGEMHHDKGIVGIADGSVRVFSTPGLQKYLHDSVPPNAVHTNWIVLPE